jgi:hypothetical protein
MYESTAVKSTGRRVLLIGAVIATLFAIAMSALFTTNASAVGTNILTSHCYTNPGTCGYVAFNPGSGGFWCYANSQITSGGTYPSHSTFLDTQYGRIATPYSTAQYQQMSASGWCSGGPSGYGITQPVGTPGKDYTLRLYSGTP